MVVNHQRDNFDVMIFKDFVVIMYIYIGMKFEFINESMKIGSRIYNFCID